MIIPPSEHPIWRDLVNGKITCEFDYLATRLLLGRLMAEVAQDPAPETIRRCASELHCLFERIAHLPTPRRDLKKIAW